jgi:hypothetical protein
MTQAIKLNLDYARKNEGYYYGEGAAMLAERVALAAAKRKSPKGRATAAYKAMCGFAADIGCKPEIECFMQPERGGWRVSFEAGPFDWAVVASEALCQVGIFAEPYYSFDLCFYAAD